MCRIGNTLDNKKSVKYNLLSRTWSKHLPHCVNNLQVWEKVENQPSYIIRDGTVLLGAKYMSVNRVQTDMRTLHTQLVGLESVHIFSEK